MRDIEKIDGLKDIVTSWLRDPIFDLTDCAVDNGFSEYRKETRIYELQWLLKWEYKHMERLIKNKDQFEPVSRAFALEESRKNIANWTDEIFFISGMKNMNFIK